MILTIGYVQKVFACCSQYCWSRVRALMQIDCNYAYSYEISCAWYLSRSAAGMWVYNRFPQHLSLWCAQDTVLINLGACILSLWRICSPWWLDGDQKFLKQKHWSLTVLIWNCTPWCHNGSVVQPEVTFTPKRSLSGVWQDIQIERILQFFKRKTEPCHPKWNIRIQLWHCCFYFGTPLTNVHNQF